MLLHGRLVVQRKCDRKPADTTKLQTGITQVLMNIFIDREAREIMHLVASVRLSVCLSTLSRLNRLTYDLDFWHGGRP